MEALERLKEYLKKLSPDGLCVAFSGGVDSSVVLAAACEIGAKAHAVTVHTLLHPLREPEEARALAEGLGAAHHILEPQLPQAMLQNPRDRCYLCKKALFSEIGEYATQHGLRYILDGSNADDDPAARPGMRALEELDVRSPLRALGFTKQEVRSLARRLGLSVANRPANPCLATRLPYGEEITREKLARIDRMEQKLKDLGISEVRARAHTDLLRLEVPRTEFDRVLSWMEEIVDAAKAEGWSYVTLDLEGFRSGSMDL